MKYISILEEPFVLSGFPWIGKNKNLCRLPMDSLHLFSEGLKAMAWHTSGGMVRFRTDSERIWLKAKLKPAYMHPNIANTALAGFDFYMGEGRNKAFYSNIYPEYDTWKVEGEIGGSLDRQMREWTIYLPLYCGVESIEVGIMEDASILPPKGQTFEKPIVYYGPSITQGACASRPGNAYTHIVSRWLDASFINYGFGGNAKGEPELAKIIASMDMSVLVIDYDYNAPNPQHLKATHEEFFKIIREQNPLLPIVFTTMPHYHHPMGKMSYDEIEERRGIIYQTFENAKKTGDDNVYFKDGYEFFDREIADSCTVDGVHPSDIGMLYIAKAIYPILKDILK